MYFFDSQCILRVEIGCWWLVSSCKLLSAWITVAITAERLIAVVQPLKVATLSTTRRARRVIVSLTLICFVLAVFPLWTVGSEEFKGMPTCIRLERSSYRPWLIAVVVIMTLTLPCCILVVCTVVITFFLSRSQHFRTSVSLWTLLIQYHGSFPKKKCEN